MYGTSGKRSLQCYGKSPERFALFRMVARLSSIGRAHPGIAAHRDNISGFHSNIGTRPNRNSHIGLCQGRSIVNSITYMATRLPSA